MARDRKPRTRMTRQRQTILEILRSTSSHPTADWIHAQARKRISNISLGTVYRNLKVLKEMGEIVELDYGSTFSRFDGNPISHYHFVCEECGRVYDIDLPVDQGLEEKVRQRTGFEIRSHRTEFYGLCLECQGRKD